MNLIAKQYGKWLGGMTWNFIATVRPHYKLTEYIADLKFQRLVEYPSINQTFYALEWDRDTNFTHAHLLLNADSTLSREDLARKLRLNPKAVGYFQTVADQQAVSNYCSKQIGTKAIHYNFFKKGS